MPPKKKKGKGKKKASKKDDAKLELEDSYKRTLDEIAALKDHLEFLWPAKNFLQEQFLEKEEEADKQLEDNFKELTAGLSLKKILFKAKGREEWRKTIDSSSVRRDLTRRAQSASLDITKRMEETERLLKEHKEDQKDINADMTRQYKTMQTEMGLRIHQLETELGRTRTQLSATEAELKKSYEDRKKMIDEKDNIIKDLKLKIDSMEKAYDNVLREALDNLIIKLDAAKLLWDQHSSLIQSKNKQTLLEFGLNPQDI